MGWAKKGLRTYSELENGQKIRFRGIEGKVFKTLYYEKSVSPFQIAVVFDDGGGLIHHVHSDDVEVFVPDPPAKEYEPSDYFQHIETGALYKKQFSGMRWHLICVGQLRPSIELSPCDSSIPGGFKRLYKEV